MCKITQEKISEALRNLNNTQLLGKNLLTQNEILIEATSNSERFRTDTIARLNNALKLIQVLTQVNDISTALNTNRLYFTNFYGLYTELNFGFTNTVWHWKINGEEQRCGCQLKICSLPVGFYTSTKDNDLDALAYLVANRHDVAYLVPGFFGSCTPYQAIYHANFICLYDKQCIISIANYFPRIFQVR